MKSLSFALAFTAAISAHATILFDNRPDHFSWTNRSGGGIMPAGHWQNSNASSVTLGSVGFYADFTQTTNVKYVFADWTGFVFDSVVVNHIGHGVGTYFADVNWTVNAGQEFFIVSMIESGSARIGYGGGSSQNGLNPLGNGNFSDYSDPTFEGNASATMTWVLDSQPVPEPGTMAVLGLGLAAAARRRRRF